MGCRCIIAKPWKRSVLRFESRASERAGGQRSTAIAATNQDSSDDEDGAAAVRAEAPMEDSSDDDDDSPLDMPELVPASHGDSLGPNGTRAETEWTRDDHFAFDERARHGHESRSPPQLTLHEWAGASLFTLGKHFLPMLFLSALAESMTQTGQAKFKAGDRRFKSWKVSTNDVLQWIGVWVYMLACGCTGGHRVYFGKNSFGGSHFWRIFSRLEAKLVRQQKVSNGSNACSPPWSSRPIQGEPTTMMTSSQRVGKPPHLPTHLWHKQ